MDSTFGIFGRVPGIAVVVLIVGITPRAAYPQVSPGKLAAPHAGLEGVTNCTRCHEVGRRVTDRRCMDCHVEITARVRAGRGYHNRVRGRACISCHSDHNGRDYEMVQWEGGKERFDHNLSGYRLEGKHAGLACEKCHRPEFVQDEDLKKRPGIDLKQTFLGLGRACISCHPDIHQGQLNPNCGSCHSADTWKPVDRFSHDNAKYKLTGRHRQIECVRCHPPVKNAQGVVFVQYTGISFQGCVACHRDVHRGMLGTTCERCHGTDGWRTVAPGRFDHSRTRYALEGKHTAVPCEKCHGVADRRYRLEYKRCSDCHADVHMGELAHRADRGACEACHTVAGFLPATYDVAEHQKSQYPLVGAHAAVPCNACHVRVDVGTDRERVRFRWEQTTCSDCHADVHGGQFAARACEACHQIASWHDLRFTHDQSRFRLSGKHAQTPCGRCHRPIAPGSPQERVVFKPLPTDCQACHRDIHYRQFERTGGQTACGDCHNTDIWKPARFTHNVQSRFKLTGVHERLPCEKCHPEVSLNREIKAILYRPISTACSACHRDAHPVSTAARQSGHTPLNPGCGACHTTVSWETLQEEIVFDHGQTAFPLTGRHVRLGCRACHRNRDLAGTPGWCSACHQDVHRGEVGDACERCHNTGSWDFSEAYREHQQTRFPLAGAHASTDCTTCHLNQQREEFVGLPTDCFACHHEAYKETKNPDHMASGFSTDCAACHGANGWRPARVSHGAFPLEGAHQTADCAACHKDESSKTPTACDVCHRGAYERTRNPDHVASGFSRKCGECHTARGWSPASFDHGVFFPIASGPHRRPCEACHPVPSDMKIFTCTDCHNHRRDQMNEKHQKKNKVVQDYVYESQACYTCHPAGREREGGKD